MPNLEGMNKHKEQKDMTIRNITTLRQDPVLSFAEDQLRTHVKGMSEQQFVIATWQDCQERLSPVMQIHWPWLDHGSLSYDGDAYTIISHHQTIILTGHNERSTLYAVYHYLKSSEGLEWIYPGEQAVQTAKASDIHSTDFGIIQPEFKRRGFVYENLKDEAYLIDVVDWLAKNRINELFMTFPLWNHVRDSLEPEMMKRGISLTLGGHSMKFFTESLHNLGMNQHADLPAFLGKKQLDYTNQEWQQSVIDDITAYCEHTKVITRLSLWPEDTGVTNTEDHPFIAQYIAFTERLQQSLRDKGLTIDVEHIAYNAGLSWNMIEIPSGMNTSSSIDTLFAYWGRDYSQGLASCERAEEQRAYKSLQQWVEQTQQQKKELTIFEYYSDHYMLSYLFPNLPHQISEDLLHYRELGITSIVNLVVPYPQAKDSSTWKWAQGFNSYVFARSAWGDPLEDILTDYWYYFSESERDIVQELMISTEKLVAPITSFNVPLFPLRVVDQGDSSPETAQAIISVLERISNYLRTHLTRLHNGGTHESNPSIDYLQGLYNSSTSILEVWKNKI